MKQAVVLIHGIGEQRPLETLRSFVDALKIGNGIKNKPDIINLSLELRRLQVVESRNMPVTDFYEFYWAHHMRDTKLRMVFQWVSAILLKWPWKINKKIFPFYLIGWLFAICTVTYFYKSVIELDINHIKILPPLLLLDYIFLRVALSHIGDAARYLNPHPDNIDQRNKIRTECIQLLHKLHTSKQYSRIVVVGHSLGSVIAYDAIRFYWSLYLSPESLTGNKQPTLKSFIKSKQSIFNSEQSINAKVQKYQELQNELWFELRESGLPWLISDFISLGSPLTHAEMLLANNENEFRRKKHEGEYPECPPCDSNIKNIYVPKTLERDEGKKETVKFPTYHSPFACTRWTNMYFPHKLFFLGDFIGGPLQKNFGSGIRDVPVLLRPPFKRFWNSHILYWHTKEYYEGNDHPLKRLKSYLNLDCLQGNRRCQKDWPSPP